jgi:hypothetical protein
LQVVPTPFYQDLGNDDKYEGFYLENRDEDEDGFTQDRMELLDATSFFLKGRFDPLRLEDWC